jgi:hypothetical protein
VTCVKATTYTNGTDYATTLINPVNAELNPIRHLLALAGAHHFELNPLRHLLALAGAHHFVHVSRIRVK